MKQIDKNKLCYRCAGCNRLELENFEGIYRCNHFTQLERIEDEKCEKRKTKYEYRKDN